MPRRCHRRLVADVLVANGHQVPHVMSPKKADEHALSEGARPREDGSVIWPSSGQLELFGDEG